MYLTRKKSSPLYLKGFQNLIFTTLYPCKVPSTALKHKFLRKTAVGCMDMAELECLVIQRNIKNVYFMCAVTELGGLARRAAGCSAFSAPSPSAHHDSG